MDFRFTPEQQAWRDEVRSWLQGQVAEARNDGEADYLNREDFLKQQAFHQKLAAKGWLTMAWPTEYGGGGAGIIDQLIFNEEFGYQRGPNPGPGIGFIGPSIMIAGTEDQKKQFLPPIANAEVWWCQGFSEPDTGSDLASLKTRADIDGDDFVVNGTKIWTSNAHHADWCYLAVRTDQDAPKHKGISLLLCDMTSPGLTMTPIINMAGGHSFNQLFFDNVRVPRANLLGEMNRGWYVMMATLGFERSGVGFVGGMRRTFEELVDYARSTLNEDGQPIASDPVVADKLAQLRVEMEIAKLLAYQTASVQLHGKVPDKEASLAKIYSADLLKRIAEVGLAIFGPATPPADTLAGRLHHRMNQTYLHAISSSMAGGTSEIQRTIVATRGLGMPR